MTTNDHALRATRRAFLVGVAALLAAPVKAFLPSRLNRATGARRWLWVHASKFIKAPDNTRVVLTITAQRSDGEYFYVHISEWLEDFEAPDKEAVVKLLQLDIQNAYLTLNDFLNCDCTAARACERHYILPPTPEELAELALDD